MHSRPRATVANGLSAPPQAAGGALAYVGAYMINSYDNFESFIQDKYTLVPAAIILGISAVLFFFGMLGCCSTIRESKAGLSVVRLCVFFICFAFLFTWPHVLNGLSLTCIVCVSPVLPGHRGDLCGRGGRLGVWLHLPRQGGFLQLVARLAAL